MGWVTIYYILHKDDDTNKRNVLTKNNFLQRWNGRNNTVDNKSKDCRGRITTDHRVVFGGGWLGRGCAIEDEDKQ